MSSLTLTQNAPLDPTLQATLEQIDTDLRNRFGLTSDQAAVGLADLRGNRLAMLHPDRIEYAASLPKIGILLTWFDQRPDAVTDLDPVTRRELSAMLKLSSNAAATRFSRELGLKTIERVLRQHGFYDETLGGGIWVGKHYGDPASERIGDPVADHSHAATVRHLLRFWIQLEQGQLLSPEASRAMRTLFEAPDLPHDDIKFVRGLRGRDVQILRKWGSWEAWLHDSALITGPNRHYALVALTRHPNGNAYLEALAAVVDDLLDASRTLR